MGWFKRGGPPSSGSGDKYAAPEEDSANHVDHVPSSDAGGGSASDDMSSDAGRRYVLASASGSSNQLWANSGSASILGDMRQDSFAAAGATPRTSSGGDDGGGGGKLTASRLSAFMKGSESRKASLSLSGRRAMGGLFSSSKKKLGASASSKSLGAASTMTTSSLRSEARSTAGNRWRRAALQVMAEKNQMLENETEHEEEEERARQEAANKGRRSARASWSEAIMLVAVNTTSKAAKGAKKEKKEKHEGISRSGPHPTEIKRENEEPASTPLEDVARSGVLIVPAKGNARKGTNELVTVLAEYAGFEMHEYVYDRSDLSDITAAMFDEGCGVVVNGLDGVDPQLW